MMTDVTKRITTFDLGKYVEVKPAAHTLIVISADGQRHELNILQLELFLAYAAKYPNMGAALDVLALGPHQS